MPASPLGGSVLLIAAAVAYDVLLAAVRKADRAFPSTNPVESVWWFGYARDLTNFAGAAGYFVAFLLLGFRGPLALLAAFVLALVTYALDFVLARGISVRRAELLLGAALAPILAAILLMRRQLEAALAALVAALF